MATFRGNFGPLLAPGIDKIMKDEWAKLPEEYSQYCVVKTSDRAFEDTHRVAGFGLARLKNEGASVTFDDPLMGPSKRAIHETYALAFQVTDEMIADDQYDIIQSFPKDMARSMQATAETLAIVPLNTGFSSTTTADGVAFFSASHPLQDPSQGEITTSTQSNLLNPAAELSVTALQDALILYENQVNERGLRIAISPDKLYIPPQLQFTAAKILQSQFDPESGENAVNPLYNRLVPCVLHRLTDTTNWFLASKDENKYTFYWRMRPKTAQTDDFNTGSAQFKSTMRCSVVVTDYRGWVGSNP